MLSEKRLVFSLIVLFALISQLSAIGLNEIMFDPDGNENTDEFVELYNESAFPVNLTGWTVSDGEGTDTIVALEQGLLALPHQYVLIMDRDYFTSGSTTYDGRVPETALVVTISGSTLGGRGLSNSEPESVFLVNPVGDTSSSHIYSIGNLNGRSDERILLSGGEDSTNWADALVQHGTPGGRNSVTPPERDLAISRLEASPSVPRQGETFSLLITVTNPGLTAMSDSLVLYERWPAPGGDSLAVVASWIINLLLPGDSLSYAQTGLTASSAPRYFRAQLSGNDDRPDNNTRDVAVSPTGLTGTIVINEIMYSPDAGMSEWIELLNASFTTAQLAGWSVGDGTAIADSSRRFALPDVSLAPDSFLVLAADSAVFFENLPSTSQVIIMDGADVTLNNNGDSLLVWDQSNTLIDRVDYRPSWGGETGVSLERVSATAGSDDLLNWATSLDSTGGTPGRMNSRALHETNGSQDILSLQPNPFSPNGDGRDDLLAIRYRLEHADSRMDLKIFDIRGREVRRLASNATAGYAGELLWDGTDSRGRSMPTGLYIIYLEALGKGGSRIQTARRVAALARPS